MSKDALEAYLKLPLRKQKKLRNKFLKKALQKKVTWPKEYKSARTGKVYIPHNDEEKQLVYSDRPKNLLLKGGEGAGKSLAGVIKDLERVRRGMSGLVLSTDLQHFKKSLWQVLLEWIPWECVLPRHKKLYTSPGWTPSQMFDIIFISESGIHAKFICGGITETDVMGWEGPNVSFVHFDEARRHKTPKALKMFGGRTRIPGPNKEPPQIYLTTTPKKHWLFDYFGPMKEQDILEKFKKNSFVATIFTEENADNLSENFVQERAETLNESEVRILLYADWEDDSDIQKFLGSMLWWDNCQEKLPPLDKRTPVIMSLDAAKGGEKTTLPDGFAIALISRHPKNREHVAIRYTRLWLPPPNGLLDFSEPKAEIRRLCKEFNVIEVSYDPHQLHDTCTTMQRERLANFKEFPQKGSPILLADKRFRRRIIEQTVAHDGNELLRSHIDNADVKLYGEEGIRLVKRNDAFKIDLARVCSTGVTRCLYYNLW